MSDTMTATTDQWMQFYHQDSQILLPQHKQGLSSEYATVMTTTTSSTIHQPSSENVLSPKGNVSKPIRRRSRASKRTPTTLLNANTSNFRALVQQFTGCPATSNLSSSIVGVHKGPITLNFQQGISKHEIHHAPATTTRILRPTFHHQQQQQQVAADAANLPWQREQHDQVQILPQQQSGYSYGMDVSGDGVLLEDDFGLHDLSVNNSFPNDSTY